MQTLFLFQSPQIDVVAPFCYSPATHTVINLNLQEWYQIILTVGSHPSGHYMLKKSRSKQSQNSS